MPRTFRTLAAVMISVLVSTGTQGLPRSRARDSMNPRAIPAYGWPGSGLPLAAALAPDGRRVAVLAILPPASLGAGPFPLAVQIWDTAELKLLATREISVPPRKSSSPDRDIAPLGCFVRYAGNGAFLVVSEGGARERSDSENSFVSESDARVHILAAADLREMRSIDLELSPDPTVYEPVDIQVSGDRMAVALSPIDLMMSLGAGATCKAFQGSEVRVYDLGSGRMLWKAPFETARIGGVGWAPDGSRLALTLQSAQEADTSSRGAFCPEPRIGNNLLILDSASGGALRGISTGDLAGPVCFGSLNEVLTASFHFFYGNTSGEKVKVWNAQTGALERTIAYPGRDVHDLLALSRDGSVLVGYIGKEKFGYSWHAMADMAENVDEKFAIWDARTGTLLRTSPSLVPLTHPGKRAIPKEENGWLPPPFRQLSDLVMHLEGNPEKPQLQLAADGSKILVSWKWRGAPLIFDVPDAGTAHPK